MSVLIVSTALRAGSKTRLIAGSLRVACDFVGAPAALLDLAATPLPLCDGGSYLAPLSPANSLRVDHRCLVVPRFVFFTPMNFESDGRLGAGGEIPARLADLLRELTHLAPHWPMAQPA